MTKIRIPKPRELANGTFAIPYHGSPADGAFLRDQLAGHDGITAGDPVGASAAEGDLPYLTARGTAESPLTLDRLGQILGPLAEVVLVGWDAED